MKTLNPDWLARVLRTPLTWVLVAAAALRVVFHLTVRADPTFTVPMWDEAVYDEMARSISHGHGIGFAKAYFFGPLYPYYLGLVYAVTGDNAGAAIFLQHVLGLVLAGMTYALARKWFGRAESLVAAAVLALSGVQVFFEGKLLMEVLVSTLLAGGLLLAAGLRSDLRPARLAGAGLLFSLAATGRPTLLLVAPLGLLPLLCAPRPPLRRLCVNLVVYAVAVMAFPVATFVRNEATEGAPVFMTSSGGYNFYAGNTVNPNERVQLHTDQSWNAEATAEIAAGRDLNSAEVSRYWMARALAEIRQDPAGWVVRYLRKVDLFLGGQDVPQIESYTIESERRLVLRRFTLAPRLLTALALAGLLAMLPRRRDLALLYGAVAVITVTTALFFVTTRYRVMVLPYLGIFAGAFVIAAMRAVRGRAWKSTGVLAAAGLAAVLFTAPSRHPVDRQAMLYGDLLHRGLQLTRVGRYDEAIEAYRQACLASPGDYEAPLNLGVTYREKGDLPASLASLQAAAASPNNDPEVPYQLGVTLYSMNRFEDAVSALTESLRMNPRRGTSLSYLGLVHAAEGHYAEARAELERGLELDPSQPLAWNNLGALLGLQGDRAGAKQSFQKALAVDDGFTPARFNLAKALLDDGDAQAAARELRRVVAEAPENTQAADMLRSIEGARRP